MKSLDEIIFESFKSQGEIYHYLSSQNEVSMLDLGCGVPLYFFNLYHLYGMKEFTGIEILKTEQACIDTFLNRQANSSDPGSRKLTHALLNATSFFEVYTYLLQTSTEDPNIGLPGIENKDVFDSIFTEKVKFDTDAYEFLEKDHLENKYNIIHCNNLLHFWPLEKQKTSIEIHDGKLERKWNIVCRNQ